MILIFLIYILLVDLVLGFAIAVSFLNVCPQWPCKVNSSEPQSITHTFQFLVSSVFKENLDVL